MIDLSKHQALDADAKAIQQVNFTANLYSGRNVDDQIINGNIRIFFIIEEAKKNHFMIFTRDCKNIVILALL